MNKNTHVKLVVVGSIALTLGVLHAMEPKEYLVELASGNIAITRGEFDALNQSSTTIANHRQLDDSKDTVVELGHASLSRVTMRAMIDLVAHPSLQQCGKKKQNTDSQLIELVKAADFLGIQSQYRSLVNQLAQRLADKTHVTRAMNQGYLAQYNIPENVGQEIVRAIKKVSVDGMLLQELMLNRSMITIKPRRCIAYDESYQAYIAKLCEVVHACFSADGTLCAVRYSDGYKCIRDTRTGKVIPDADSVEWGQFHVEQEFVDCGAGALYIHVANSPDRSQVALIGPDESVIIRNTPESLSNNLDQFLSQLGNYYYPSGEHRELHHIIAASLDKAHRAYGE